MKSASRVLLFCSNFISIIKSTFVVSASILYELLHSLALKQWSRSCFICSHVSEICNTQENAYKIQKEYNSCWHLLRCNLQLVDLLAGRNCIMFDTGYQTQQFIHIKKFSWNECVAHLGLICSDQTDIGLFICTLCTNRFHHPLQYRMYVAPLVS